VADAARTAFVDSLHTTTLIAAVIMALGAVGALVSLRNVPAVLPERQEDEPAGTGQAPEAARTVPAV
jgi:DHA2 family multidrug resistance protein-like MFS transporter